MSQKDLKYTILEADVSSRLHTTNMNIDVIQEEKLPVLKKCDVTSQQDELTLHRDKSIINWNK
jgi:hypothetical protein